MLNALQKFIGWLGDLIELVLDAVLYLLPDSPFQKIELPAILKDYLGYINWFIPFQLMSRTLLVWLSAIIVYYAYQSILRWTKAIS